MLPRLRVTFLPKLPPAPIEMLTGAAVRPGPPPWPHFPRAEQVAPAAQLLQPEGLDAVVVLRGVLRVDAVGERLDDAEQRRVRAHIGGAVGGVVELDFQEFGDLREGRV